MAQRKPPPSKPTGRSGGTRPQGSTKTGATPPGKRPTGRPQGKKPKSIVNQKQTPWGMISAAVAVVLFAAVVVVVVVATRKSDSGGGDTASSSTKGGQTVNKNDPYRQPPLAAATAIQGVTYHVEGEHTHVEGTVKYDTSPPTGGNHAPIWATCTGVVYDHQLASENAVHAMEHGGVWVTYNPAKLSTAQVTALSKDVNGVDRVFMTPYAGLKTPVSLQAWGYQLFVNSPTDPRIKQFISVLSTATANWPERGATCSDPYFDAASSKPGSPQEST